MICISFLGILIVSAIMGLFVTGVSYLGIDTKYLSIVTNIIGTGIVIWWFLGWILPCEKIYGITIGNWPTTPPAVVAPTATTAE